eukprot:COSAG04_NODE_8486_length_967_cov_4.048387_2_plen_65_part_01
MSLLSLLAQPETYDARCLKDPFCNPRYQSGEYVANEDCTAAQPCEYDLHFLSSGIGAILHFENVC